MAINGIMTVEYVSNGIIARDNNDCATLFERDFSCVGLTGDESQTIGDIFVGTIDHFMENNDCDKVKITYKIEAL